MICPAPCLNCSSVTGSADTQLSPASSCRPGLPLLQGSIKALILLQVSHNRRWLQIRLQWRWLGISGPNNQTVLLERLSLQLGNHFCYIFGGKCTTMASDFNVPAVCESAQCSSQSMSAAETRTCLSHSLTCVISVGLSRKLLHLHLSYWPALVPARWLEAVTDSELWAVWGLMLNKASMSLVAHPLSRLSSASWWVINQNQFYWLFTHTRHVTLQWGSNTCFQFQVQGGLFKYLFQVWFSKFVINFSF